MIEEVEEEEEEESIKFKNFFIIKKLEEEEERGEEGEDDCKYFFKIAEDNENFFGNFEEKVVEIEGIELVETVGSEIVGS